MTPLPTRDQTITERHAGPTQAAGRPGNLWRRVGLILLLLAGWLVLTPAFAVNTTCGPATSQGTAPADYQSYCWIDFSAYVDSTARSGAGQPFVVTLSNGAVMSFTLKASGALNRVGVPSWSGAAFGNNATFDGIPGQPVLYTASDGSTVTLSLNSITVDTSGGPAPFAFVAADGESTNNNESLSFTTSGNPWTLLASIPYSGSALYPGLSGVGTATVTESGVAGTVGSYAFASAGSPSTVTAVLNAGGLQGALFGVKFVGPDLGITKSHAGNFATGTNGSYNLAVHNYSFYATSGTTTVTDTLPTGLSYVSASGSGWTCSAAGQNVTCSNPSTVASGGNLPPITLTVAVAGNAPASVSNTATVTTLGDYSKANNSSTDVATVVRSDLSSSTKTVLDTNGGDTNPGDTLRYTITLTNSTAGVATGVSVSDDMPAGVGGLSVISTPAGSSNGSTTNGGANNTGKVSVSGISVPANGSVSIVYEVTVSGSAASGSTIDNSATISNPNGTGGSPDAPTVTVSQSQVAGSGNKILYVQDANTLTRTPQAANTTTPVTITGNSSATWVLTPGVAAGKTLVIPAQTIVVNLVMATSGTGTKSIVVSLFNGNTLIASAPAKNISGSATALQNFSINMPATTIAAGGTLNLRVQSTPISGTWVSVSQKTTGQGASTFSFNTSTVINVDSVNNYSAAYPAVTSKSSYAPGDTVYVRAVISDPFGSYDVRQATVTLTDPNGATQVVGAAMTQKADSGAATRTYEYSYTLPANAATGYWTASVTGYEGTENTVTHTANGTFNVGVPNLLVMKSVSVISDPVEGTTRPKSLPGAVMQYQITVSNNGSGPADNNSLVITDPLPANTKFVIGSVVFAEGTPGSGLSLAPANVTYSSTGSSGPWTYAPVNDGSGADGGVKALKIAPQGIMAGKTGASAPNFSVTFRVIVL
ncbi:beta strand repeat-containing protein [Rhodanobacter ginsengiterrae]|uniref:beta strand repeat-containing protein n=1 Tax=Rhodanobacter ginsengiterrae TaxID=2008451 RepID=UPI003CF85D9E